MIVILSFSLNASFVSTISDYWNNPLHVAIQLNFQLFFALSEWQLFNIRFEFPCPHFPWTHLSGDAQTCNCSAIDISVGVPCLIKQHLANIDELMNFLAFHQYGMFALCVGVTTVFRFCICPVLTEMDIKEGDSFQLENSSNWNCCKGPTDHNMKFCQNLLKVIIQSLLISNGILSLYLLIVL
jgi:hypothetical protein